MTCRGALARLVLALLVVAAAGDGMGHRAFAAEWASEFEPARWRVLRERPCVGPDGRVLVPAEVFSTLPTRSVEATLDDGRRIRLTRVVLHAAPARPRSGWVPVTAWLDGEPPQQGGNEVALLTGRLPLDAAGQSLRAGGRRRELTWLPPRIDLRALASPVPAEHGGTLGFGLEVGRLTASPFQAWRGWLARGELPSPERMEAGTAAELAGHIGRLWSVGLDRLYRSDAELSRRLRSVLVSAIDFGPDASLPVWVLTPREEADLLSDLLNAGLADAQLLRRVRFQLESVKRLRVWVVAADGAPRDPLARRLTLGVANLTGEPLPVVWDGGEPDSVPPRSAKGFLLPPSVRGVTIGGESVAIPELAVALLERPAVRPPGLTMVPEPGHSLLSWLGRGAGSFPNIVARLERFEGRWRVLYESDSAEAGVLLVRGPGDAAAVEVELGAGVVRGEVRVPDQWLGADGSLTLGLEVIRGGRARTWPLPVMPGQRTRPRLTVDTAAWDGLEVIKGGRVPSREPSRDLGRSMAR
ncbi:MAG: hypothetical protein AAF108_06995 [Planctomycetota bacterium]